MLCQDYYQATLAATFLFDLLIAWGKNAHTKQIDSKKIIDVLQNIISFSASIAYSVSIIFRSKLRLLSKLKLFSSIFH